MSKEPPADREAAAAGGASGAADIDTFAGLFRDFLEQVVYRAPERDSPLLARLRGHLGVEPRSVPLSGARFAPFEHPDVQAALDAYVAAPGRSAEVIGLGWGHGGMGFGDLLAHHGTGQIGPVGFVQVPVDIDEQASCMSAAVLLVSDAAAAPHAIAVLREDQGPVEGIAIDVLSPDPAHSTAVLEELRQAMTARSVYRGKVFALTPPNDHFRRNVGAEFLARPSVDRDEIVLPEGRLDLVERRTIAFDGVAQRLADQGQHRKRGLLLYGPPGTGKTLTARYLIGQMAHRTVIVLTGRGLGAVAESASLARRLEPSMLVLEDVDLVAHDRTFGPSQNPLLFELLNQLDGLGDDADVLVVLTTNRAELLEPALAARPGRVDLAVELPLPDTDARRRLFELFSRSIACAVRDWGPAVERTDGTPASFVREVIRTAALSAAQAGEGEVTMAHVDAALTELLDSGPLTAALLGARVSDPADWPPGVPLPPGHARGARADP